MQKRNLSKNQPETRKKVNEEQKPQPLVDSKILFLMTKGKSQQVLLYSFLLIFLGACYLYFTFVILGVVIVFFFVFE